MVVRDDHLPHSLVPLAMAIAIVRSRVAGTAMAEPDAVATLIASAVPVFEYWDNPLWLPRPLPNVLRNGVFRNGGRELRFVDGRPTKHRVAVRVEDVDCLVEMLLHPERATFIRNRVLRDHARKLVSRSHDLSARSAELRGTAEKLLARASLVSQPAYPGAAPSP